MADSMWNWYATQELRGILAREGLRCTHCARQTQHMTFNEADATFQCQDCHANFSPTDYYAALRRAPKLGQSTLYRPVGEAELAKIAESEFAQFPPRLQWQPIFYPVLTSDYADAIARDWNSQDPAHNFVGFVTRFQVRNEFLSNYEIQVAADKTALEYWIPAEDLPGLNENIVGKIEVVAEFHRGQLVRREATGAD